MHVSKPDLYSYAKEALTIERDETLLLIQQLEEKAHVGANTEGKDMKELQRALWKLNGVLELGLDMDLLTQVTDKYAKLDLVPGSYMLAELSMTRAEQDETNSTDDSSQK